MVKRIEVFAVVLALFLLVPLVNASISVEKTDKGSVVISELNNPAVYDFTITNDGPTQSAEIYTLIGVVMTPRGTFEVPSGNSTVEVKAYPTSDMRQRSGLYNVQYQIKGSEFGIFNDQITFEVVNLKDALAISAQNLRITDSQATVTVKNLKNTNLDNLGIHTVSSFFDSMINVSLRPYEEVNVSVPVNMEKAKALLAGPYVVLSEIDFAGVHTRIEGVINYLEKEDVLVTQSSSGWIIKDATITKTNVGNKRVVAHVEMTKDIVSRLFTTFSVEPTSVSRHGIFVDYAWDQEIAPAAALAVTSTTNYTVPFVLIVLVLFLAFVVWAYTRTNVVVTKKVSLVRTRGGEFALKVGVHVRARKHVDNVQIVDRLPSGTKIYEKFGTRPDKIEESTRRLFWNIRTMNSGEERVFSYIIYSKLKIVGTFELPAASALFEKDGKMHEVISNRAFFASELVKSED